MLYKLENLHNPHQKFVYIIVLPIMNLCQIRCKDCPYFVCVHLSLDFWLCRLGSEELCIPCEETYPGVPGGWVTVVMPEPLDSVTPGIVLCVCNPCIGSPIIPCEERYPSVPSRRGTVELVDPLKQCGSPAIVLWVCDPYSEVRHSLKRGVFTGGYQAVVRIMCCTNWNTHWHRTEWREIKTQIN